MRVLVTVLVFTILGPPLGFTIYMLFNAAAPSDLVRAPILALVVLRSPDLQLAAYVLGVVPALAAGLLTSLFVERGWPAYLLAGSGFGGGSTTLWIAMLPRGGVLPWAGVTAGATAALICAGVTLVADRAFTRAKRRAPAHGGRFFQRDQ